MSHFSVVVIGKDWATQLLPYKEYDSDGPPEFIIFEDEEDKILQRYETESIKMIKGPDDKFYFEWDKKFNPPVFSLGSNMNNRIIPNDHVEVMVAFKDLYKNFDEFAKEYCGYKTRDPKMNRYGIWNNPNAKWDWCTMGGRWSGYFPLKSNGKSQTYANQAALKDIDFVKAQNDMEADARFEFSKWKQCFTTCGQPEAWPDVYERICGTSKDPTLSEQARNYYANQPTIKLAQQLLNHVWWENCFVETFGYDEEKYVLEKRRTALVPFALVKDGKWSERGEMGWFGTSRNEMEYKEWCKFYWDLLTTLPPETQLTLVDCHI